MQETDSKVLSVNILSYTSWNNTPRMKLQSLLYLKLSTHPMTVFDKFVVEESAVVVLIQRVYGV